MELIASNIISVSTRNLRHYYYATNLSSSPTKVTRTKSTRLLHCYPHSVNAPAAHSQALTTILECSNDIWAAHASAFPQAYTEGALPPNTRRPPGPESQRKYNALIIYTAVDATPR